MPIKNRKIAKYLLKLSGFILMAIKEPNRAPTIPVGIIHFADVKSIFFSLKWTINAAMDTGINMIKFIP